MQTIIIKKNETQPHPNPRRFRHRLWGSPAHLKALLASGLAALGCLATPTSAQTTAFNYQGRLNVSGSPANGSYDFQFGLWSAASGPAQLGGTQTSAATAVSNGLFLVTLDFGANFPGADRWLEIAVRTNGNGSFVTLASRQPVTPTPYAITAGSVIGPVPAALLTGTLPSGVLAGTYGSSLTLNNAGNSFTGDGVGLTEVNASLLGGLSANQFWKLAGNGGTTPGVNFVGTTDNRPLEFKANGQRALRLEPNSSTGGPNLIGGSPVNYVAPGSVGATIGGGGALAYIELEPALGGFFSASSNSIFADFGTLGGGGRNLIQTNSNFATIAGGAWNTIQTNSRNAVIGGGLLNTVQTNAPFATIAGGILNSAQGFGAFIGGGGYDGLFPFAGNAAGGNASVISGGVGNSISTGNDYSAVGGGLFNAVGYQSGLYSANSFGAVIGGGGQNTNYGSYAVIPGGYKNQASGSYSFAAGQNAQARHDGAFVWADASTTTSFSSTASNQFLIRASFVGINRTNPVTGADSFAVRSPATSGYGGIYVDTAGAAGWPFYGYAQGGLAQAWTYLDGSDGNKWKLFNSGVKLTVTPAGNVGIGTTAPSAPMHIQGAQAFERLVSTSTLNGSVLEMWNTTPKALDGPPVTLGAINFGNASTTPGQIAYTDANTHYLTFRVGGVDNMMSLSTAGLSVHGTFVSSSDRNVKENFQPVDARQILDKVTALPVTRWNYKQDTTSEHIGPMAQDFYAAFNVGPDDKHIATIDESGVALVAIQGLNQKVEEKDGEIKELKQRLQRLEQIINAGNGGAK